MINEKMILDSRRAISAMGDDREIFKEVLESYLEVTPDLFTALDNAVEDENRETVKRLAHTLKSSTLTIGGMRLGAEARSLEKSVETLDPHAMSNHVVVLKEHYEALIAALKNEGFLSE